MNLNVRKALAMNAFKDARLIAGSGGIDRVIRFVDICETPDANLWLRANTFLVTTGYSIKDNLSAQLSLLRALSAADGAGLAIKFGRFIGKVPEELCSLADELNMPLISLPDGLPFIDITYPLMTSILNEQAQYLAYSESVYLSLTKIVLEANTLDALAQGIEDILHYKVHIYAHDLRASVLSTLQDSQVFPVNIKEKTYGYIALATKNLLSEKELIAIRHAQTLAALQLINKELITESDHNYQRDFLEDILSGRIHNQEITIARAKEIGFSLNGPKYLIITDIDDFSSYLLAQQISEKAASSLKKTLFHIVQDTLMMFYGPRQCLVVQRSDRIIAICPVSNPVKTRQQQRCYFQEIFDVIRQKIHKTLRNITVTIAVSQQIKSLADFKNMHEQLLAVSTISRKLSGAGQDVFWDDAEIYFLLQNMNIPLDKFYKNILNKLDDTKKHEVLFQTLQVYLDCQGNLANAAARLFIHRNTLRYRLKRIEVLLDKDLASAETHFMLWLALKARELNKFQRKSLS